MANVQQAPDRQVLLEDTLSFYTLFTVSFVLFAVIAVVGMLCGCQWRAWLPGAEGTKSMIGGLKAAVYTFMSHLQ